MDNLERHKVRRANLLDLEEIVRFCLEKDIDYDNNLAGLAPADYEAVKSTFFSLIGPEEKGLVLLSTYTNKKGETFISGILALGRSELWWSKARVLTNVLFYVDPAYRSYNIANALLTRGKQLVDAINEPLVVNTFLFTDKVNALEKYFERKGFEKLGSTLIYLGENNE